MKYKTFFTIAFFMAIVLSAYALEPPKMQCLRLLNNNQRIKISWSNNEEDCSKYEILYFYINYQLCDSMTVSSSDNLDFCDYGSKEINNIPIDDIYHCYIMAVDSFGNIAYSDTIKSITLTVTPQESNTLAFLEWESPIPNLDNSWGNFFNLYKKRTYEPNFPSTPFATVPNNQLSYIDTSDVCSDIVLYQVSINNYYSIHENCQFMTTIGSVFLSDSTDPRAPILDSVTITPTNEVLLGFHSTEPNMMAYVIYHITENGNIALDTVRDATFWIDTGINPSSVTRTYRISVLDSCMNGSPMTEDPQKNIKLELQSSDACDKQAIINWNAYQNLHDGVDKYEVLLSDDLGQNWTSLGFTDNTSYMISNLQLNTTYIVYVRVVNTSGTITSSSNRVNFSITVETTNDFTYIRTVSVENNRHLLIKVLTSGDTLAFESLTLQRSEDGTNFVNIKTLPYVQNTANYVFYDSSINFTRNIYYYRAFITDGCGSDIAYSNIAHNLLLKGESLTQSNSLNWQAYASWDGEVGNYRVLRKNEMEDGFSPVAEVTPSSFNGFQDDVSSLAESGSKFVYYIVAEENPNDYGFAETSNSNHITLTQNPTLFIPNAFRPTGTDNNVFNPVNSFVSPDGYCLSIYSRTGDLIFISTNPSQGWNGKIKDKYAPFGVYVYHISYKLPDNTVIERDGTVTVVR